MNINHSLVFFFHNHPHVLRDFLQGFSAAVSIDWEKVDRFIKLLEFSRSRGDLERLPSGNLTYSYGKWPS